MMARLRAPVIPGRRLPAGRLVLLALAVTLPAEIVEAFGLEKGQEVDLTVHPSTGAITVRLGVREREPVGVGALQDRVHDLVLHGQRELQVLDEFSDVRALGGVAGPHIGVHGRRAEPGIAHAVEIGDLQILGDEECSGAHRRRSEDRSDPRRRKDRTTGIGWIIPKHYYTQVGKDGFKTRPIGAGPFKFVSQEAGVQMVFEAWEEYWRRPPATKTIVVRGIRDLAARMAGLQTGEPDLTYGLTGKLLDRLMTDKQLRWNRNFTAPWWLVFPGYNEPDSPFRDKRVREAISLAINRQFLVRQETQGIGIPSGNWLSPENRDALRGDGTDLPVPEYDPEKARQLLAQAGFPSGFDFEWYVPFPPYFDMGERILTDLQASRHCGTRIKIGLVTVAVIGFVE